MGEPGVEKSRLLYEFRRGLDEAATWIEGHCSAFGRAIPFLPLIDLLKRNFRIEDADSEAAIVKKIDHGVLLLGEDVKPIIPHWPHDGVSTPPGNRRRRPRDTGPVAGAGVSSGRRTREGGVTGRQPSERVAAHDPSAGDFSA